MINRRCIALESKGNARGLFRKRSSLGERVVVGTLMLFLGFSPSVLVQAAANETDELLSGAEISLKLIMSDPDWLGRQPEKAYWGDLGEHFYYSRKRPGTAINDLYRSSVNERGEATRVKPNHAAKESVAGGVWRYDPESQRYSEKLYVRNRDIYHRNLKDGQITQLTRTTTPESQPLFLNDGSIGFRRGDRFLVRDLRACLKKQTI